MCAQSLGYVRRVLGVCRARGVCAGFWVCAGLGGCVQDSGCVRRVLGVCKIVWCTGLEDVWVLGVCQVLSFEQWFIIF